MDTIWQKFDQSSLDGASCLFSSESAQIGLPLATADGSDPYTIEMWVQVHAGSDVAGGLIGWGDFSTSTPLSYNALSLDTLSGIKADWGGSILAGQAPGGSMADGAWHHLATVFDGRNQKVISAVTPSHEKSRFTSPPPAYL